MGSERPPLILALDPGSLKIGWCVVAADGEPLAQGILPFEGWEAGLAAVLEPFTLSRVVIGDGGTRVNIEPRLARLLPDVPTAVVDERGSSVEGWQLKRAEQARGVLGRVAFTLRQLLGSTAIDDYAARVLARRWLAAQRSGQ